MILLPVNTVYCHSDLTTGQDRPVYTPTVDSLLHLIDITSGAELLKLYPRLHKALYEVEDMDVHLAFNRDFIAAAKNAKDKKAEAIAYVLRVEALYNYRMPDSLMLTESLKALDFMQDVPEAEVHYFYVASVVGDIYMLQGNYEEALNYAEKFYDEAKSMNSHSGLVASLQTMGKAYEELGLLDKAEIAFRECITAADEKTDSGMKGEAYSYLVDMLNGQKRYESALEVSKEFEAYLQRIDAYNGELKNLCFLNYLGYAASYTKLGQYTLARTYISKAEGFPVANTRLGLYSVENERFSLFYEEGRYAEAEYSLNQLEEILQDETSSFQATSKIKEARAKLYFHWGKYEKAANAYKAYVAGKDSVQRVDMANKLNTLRTRHEVDKLEMQKEQQKQTLRYTLLWFSIVLILLCVILAIIVFNARKLRIKNRSMLEQIKKQDQLEAENERIRSEQTQKNTLTTENQENRKLQELYDQLKVLMKDPAVYTDPNINRRSIAKMLNTNEKYVFTAIRKYSHMSVSEYVNHLRLNYARILLSNPAEGRTIETIAHNAGFNSRSIFYHLFKEKYGMTPVEFRRLITSS
ncbi:helix-turn-helix domain-containing protein [Parabacteroides sp. PF5-9]|uniref:helix-turn-helix domain-containing protein n=1 Tax=Parabacteroides sp. PF5-9 TaxID=1742404 RepID=UPI00247473CF|nr:helix-turn-helix domain-containing protein [Parabacteroides sp. PF5-9]